MGSGPDALDLPRPFGPYTLVRRLAIGGMAEVYVAKARGIGGFEKLVAIKVIHPRYSEDEHFVRMLIEEAKISVLLTHVNIAQTYDLGCVDETYFIMMEYIEGVDAYKLLKRASDKGVTMPLDVSAYVASEVCNGLDYAHRRHDPEGRSLGIVHRDISPQNVLISFAGEVKIVDFGIAKAALRTAQTEVGVIKGKYYYMSPEQAWGDPMDHRTDIFSAGIVMYELLTGEMLYPDDNLPQLLDKVRKAEIKPPSHKRPEVPPELDRIVLKALAKKPEDRFQSAQELSQVLSAYLHKHSPAFTASRLAALLGNLFPEDQDDHGLHSGEATEHGATSVGQPGAATLAAMRPEDFAPAGASVIYDLAEQGGEESTRQDLGMAVRLAAASLVEHDAGEPELEGSATRVDDSHAHPQPPGPAARGGAPRSRTKTAEAGEQERTGAGEGRGGPVDDSWEEEATVVEADPDQAEEDAGGTDDDAESWDDETRVDDDASHERRLRELAATASALAQERTSSGGSTSDSRAADRRAADRATPSEETTSRIGRTPPSPPPPVAGAQRPASSGTGDAAPRSSSPFSSVPPPATSQPAVPAAPPSFASPAGGEWLEPLSMPRPRRGWVLVGVGLVIAAVAVVVALSATGERGEPLGAPVVEVISVPSGAEVHLDGERVPGTTRLEISQGLEVGRSYRLEISKRGYQTWSTEFEPKQGRLKQIAVLNELESELLVQTEPAGAEVWVNGMLHGASPQTIEGLQPGTAVEVRADLAGHEEVRQTVRIGDDEVRKEVNLKLEPTRRRRRR